MTRRISEQKACPLTAKRNSMLKKNHLIVNPDISHKKRNDIKSIISNGVQLSNSKPNNIVVLKSGEVFNITKIRRKQQNIYMHGFTFTNITDAFKFPCKSTEVGIMKLGKLSRRKTIISLENVSSLKIAVRVL